MSCKITKDAYQKLVDGDKEWLAKQEHSCEKMHIEAILKWSPYYAYDRVDINAVREFLKEEVGEELANKFYYKAINGGFDND